MRHGTLVVLVVFGVARDGVTLASVGAGASGFKAIDVVDGTETHLAVPNVRDATDSPYWRFDGEADLAPGTPLITPPMAEAPADPAPDPGPSEDLT